MDTKLFRMITYLDGLLTTKLQERFFMWSCEMTHKLKPLYLHYHNAYVYQTWHDVIYLDRLLPTKLHDTLIT